MPKTEEAQKLKYLNIGLHPDLHLAFKTRCVTNCQYIGDTLTALMSLYVAGEADEKIAKYLSKNKPKDA